MPGLLASRRSVAIYLLAWFYLGCAMAGGIALAGVAAPANALLFALPVNLVYAFAVGYSTYYLCRAYPLGGARSNTIPLVFLVAALAAGCIWLLLGQAWNALCRLLGVGWAGLELGASLAAFMVAEGVLLYGFAAALHYLVIEFVRATGAEQNALQARLMAQEAELRMLRTQIDPHFLFNSLNSISALTSQDPKGARRMTLELASFFRHSLGLEAHRKVTLGQEMELIRHFLAVEQVRFGARLRFAEEVSAEAAACLLPPMLIQPLVENAVKHGICHLTEGGTIRVTARRAGSVLHIGVDNPVDPDPPAGGAKGQGIGLNNVRQRLAGAYRHEASIHWGRRQNQFGVEIAMPAQLREE
ncbi:sensor histidine kinase [Janthinobacterium sp. BJB412]|nr:sensor histidine kinase [Janthinobacterium sp. BJB412]